MVAFFCAVFSGEVGVEFHQDTSRRPEGRELSNIRYTIISCYFPKLYQLYFGIFYFIVVYLNITPPSPQLRYCPFIRKI
tara:strand:- start:2729 stop:2965 length:237 start_codon:yes stop_codon:yes gene_type:complete